MNLQKVFQKLFYINSMEQNLFEYIDGYRSSCKYHSQGNVNIILSAPHGGYLMPEDVPDRTGGTYISTKNSSKQERYRTTVVKDSATIEFAENVAEELVKKWNLKPFLIIGKWHRRKVDFNRDIHEGTLNHPEAIIAYDNYHSYLTDAIEQVNRLFNKGLLIDIHGHGQGNHTMIGYMLTSDELNRDDLSHSLLKTSIDALCESDRNESIRGYNSFGTIFERRGLGIAYPSLANPKPGTRTFFSGGYIIRNYSSKINAIQTELPFDIRNGIDRRKNAQKFAHALVEYMTIKSLLSSK